MSPTECGRFRPQEKPFLQGRIMVVAEPSIARGTISKARKFLELAETLDINERQTYLALLEASVEFGRRVTWHLQKEYRHRSGFDDWYKDQVSRLRADPLFEFFVETRNIVVKEGPPAMTRAISVSVLESVAVGEPGLTVKVIRVRPWYRRAPIFWVHYIRALLMKYLQNSRHFEGKNRQRAVEGGPASIRQVWHFDDARCSDRPALDVIREYLVRLEQLVLGAEALFGSK